MAGALLQRIQELHPDASIEVVVMPGLADIAHRLPGVVRVHELAVGHGELGLTVTWSLARKLKSRNFSIAIVLRNNFKSALLPWMASIPRRVGWLGESRYGILNDWRRLDEQAMPLMIQRYVALAYPAGCTSDMKPLPLPRLLSNELRRASVVSGLDLDYETPVVALVPGAEYGPAKRWPVGHFVAVGLKMRQLGYQVWVFGSSAETEICESVADRAGGVSLAGRTSLADVVDLISGVHGVVVNDSGIMHVAAALGRPTVGIFGSTSPDHTPPIGESAEVVSIDLECRPCFARHCPLGHMQCMKGIEPDRVITRLKDVMAR